MLLSMANKAAAAALLGCLLVLLSPTPIRAQNNQQTVVDLISRDIRFSTLVTSLTAARLTETLNNDGPNTLWAPTNQAFVAAKLNMTRLLSQTWNAHLVDLLLYHAVDDDTRIENLSQGQTIFTIQGEDLVVTTAAVTGSTPLVLNNNASVIEADKIASNGVVQVLDYVLMPISATQSIYDYAKSNLDAFSTLAELIEAGDLIDALSGPGPLTIFAPTNAAFALIQDDENWEAFLQDRDQVRSLLLYHVVPGNVFRSDLRGMSSVESKQGGTIAVTSEDVVEQQNDDDAFEITLNTDSTVAIQDVLVNNGVWHIIDRVLKLPFVAIPTITELAEQEQLSVFVEAARRTGLLDTLSNPSQNLTALASSNSGFVPLFSTWLTDLRFHGHLKAAMEYQIVQDNVLLSSDLTENLVMDTLLGDEVTEVTTGSPANPIIINEQVAINKADLLASNGVLHVTDQVLVPPFQELDVVDVLVRQPQDFSTLVYLMVLTELISDLQSDGPFTIFAPTNQAFEDLRNSVNVAGGSDLLSDLDSIREILRYHVVGEVVYAEDLVHGATYETLQGSTIQVVLNAPTQYPPTLLSARYRSGGGRHLQKSEMIQSILTIDGRAQLLMTDQLAFNGVIHAVDAVVLPFVDDVVPDVLRPTAAPEDEICMQWGDFDGLCCPTDAVQRQNAPWYCDYFEVLP